MRRALTALLLLAAAVAHGRTLSWDSLEVTARLDNDARLHVTERQAMLFDGDWNGGERHFQVGAGQQLDFVGLYAIDAASGARTPLRRGSLAGLDHYDFTDAQTLRWRARLPTDPPFRHALRIYEIEYVLSGVVRRSADGYALAHDFAFPDRPGEIVHFSARLSLDSAWQLAAGSSTEIHGDHLAPGQYAIMRLQLSHLGSTAPAAIAPPHAAAAFADPDTHAAASLDLHWMTPVPAWRYSLLAVLALFVIVLLVAWHRHERGLGKFAALTPRTSIDEAWLREHVFSHPPEVVGAAWDLKTSASEVAALLARLTLEKKLASEVRSERAWFVRRDNLSLKLLVDRDSLHGYERKLVDKLFFQGSTTTDTETIREHYKSSGFDPSRAIDSGLGRKLVALLGADTRVASWRRQLTLALLVAGAAPLIATVIATHDAAVPLGMLAFPSLFLYMFARFAAESYQGRVNGLPGALLLLTCLVGALLLMAVAACCLSLYAWGAAQSISFTLVVAGLLNSVVNASCTRGTAQSLGIRKSLAAARAWFVHELGSARPQLRDEWLPYLLGFGLGPNIERWFTVQKAASMVAIGSSHSGASASAAAAAWTGGGGAFGGGGASGSWSSAVSSMAASVSSPGSSGGGGGGSSGGGGGGGW